MFPVDDDNTELHQFLTVAWDEFPDTTAWLVLADWLDEHGDPRGELIRLGTSGRHADIGAWATHYLPDWKLETWENSLRPIDEPPWLCVRGINGPMPEWLPDPVSSGWVKLELGRGAVNWLGTLPKVVSLGFHHETNYSNPYDSFNDPPPVPIEDAHLVHLRGRDDLRALSLVNCSDLTSAGLHHLASLSQLRGLDLTINAEEDLVHLTGLTQLRHLRINSRHLSGAGLRHIANLINLQYLDLNNCGELSDEGLGYLRRLTNLRSLDLSTLTSSRITDDGLLHLDKLSKLRVLNLEGCYGVTAAGLRELAERLPELGTVQVRYRTSVWLDQELRQGRQPAELEFGANTDLDAIMPIVSRCSNLRKLNLSECKELTDAHLAKLPDLQELNLYGCRNITDASVAQLIHLKNLHRLILAYCAVTADGLRHLAKLENLTHLNLECCSCIDDSALNILADLPRLEFLSLGWCAGFTEDGLLRLGDFPSLQVLVLDGCPVSDALLARLARLTHLHILYLRDSTKYTHVGLIQLQNVRELHVGRNRYTGSGFVSVGEDELEQLRQAMPNCEVK